MIIVLLFISTDLAVQSLSHHPVLREGNGSPHSTVIVSGVNESVSGEEKGERKPKGTGAEDGGQSENTQSKGHSHDLRISAQGKGGQVIGRDIPMGQAFPHSCI